MIAWRAWPMLCLLAFPPGVLAAQTNGAIEGRVLDGMTEAPVTAVLVELLGVSDQPVSRATTDDAGHFSLASLRPGRYRLRATRVGYAQALTAAVELAAGDTLNVIVRLTVEPVLLPALEVVERSRRIDTDPVLGPFYHRLEQRLGGYFITREEIDQRRASQVTDLLQASRAIVLGRPGFPGRAILITRTGRGCAPMVYLDGIPLTRSPTDPADAFDAVNMVHPSSVDGIEIYRGVASLPAEFGGSTGSCGVVAIWTRRGR
jgi:hypothetical protein